MTVDDLIARLDFVRPRGPGRWSARCAAHVDHNPSLSIREGERGILLKCWAGCDLTAICAALGLAVRDLFYDAGLPPHKRRQDQPRPPKRFDFRKAAAEYQDYALGLRLRAESVLSAARGLNITECTDADLDEAWKAVGRAYEDLDRADQLDRLAFTIRAQGLRTEQERGPQSRRTAA